MLASFTLLLLPVAATCGWWMGKRANDEQQHHDQHLIHQNYFKGLNYLINEQPDKAVDVFIKLLEVDSDTVETHLALGHLFRRRGEVDRAIRIHQNLIARPHLTKNYRVQALLALGEDYLRAGVLDRAERLFLELVEMGEEDQTSLRFLLDIYQKEKDWSKAIGIAKRLAHISGEPMKTTIAQYYCELALQMLDRQQWREALYLLKRANAVDKGCVRASMIRGRIEAERGNYPQAIKFYQQVKQQNPDFISEIVTPLAECYAKLHAEEDFICFLQSCLAEYPRVTVMLAIAQYQQQHQGDKMAIEFLANQIRLHPSLRGLRHLVQLYLQHSTGDARDKLQILVNIVQKLIDDKPIYRCVHCGYAGKTLFWLCPSCHSWSTVKPILGVEGS